MSGGTLGWLARKSPSYRSSVGMPEGRGCGGEGAIEPLASWPPEGARVARGKAIAAEAFPHEEGIEPHDVAADQSQSLSLGQRFVRVVVMAYNPTSEWDQRSSYFGASLASFEALAKRKGLRLVGCDIVGLNAFFVRENLCGDRFSPGDACTFWRPRSWWLDRAFATAPAPFGHPYEER